MAMLNFFGDNWTTGTGNIDSFGFPTHSLLENTMRIYAFSAEKVTDSWSDHYDFYQEGGYLMI